MLPSDSDVLPDQVVLANTCDRQGALVAAKLAEAEEDGGGGDGADDDDDDGGGGNSNSSSVVFTAGPADVRATLTCLVALIQKFCNTQVFFFFFFFFLAVGNPCGVLGSPLSINCS